MKEIWNWIQVAFAAIGGTLGWFLGGLDGFLYALIAFVVVDGDDLVPMANGEELGSVPLRIRCVPKIAYWWRATKECR